MRYPWLKFYNMKLRFPADGEGNDLGGSTSFVESASAADEPASDSTESDVNWTDLADELVADDASDVEGDEVVVDEPVKAEPAPTETPPTPTPSSTEPSTTEAPTTPTPQLAPPPAPTASPDEYNSWRATRLTQLEQVYALDEEAANSMLTEPELVLPKLAAKVHMEVLENSMRAMQAMVPVMLQQVQYHTEIEGRAKNLFTSVNPDLADPRYEPAIMQLGSVYRNVNKDAPPEMAAAAIGNLVRAALGIAAPQARGGQQPAPVQQQVQSAVTPFSPARGAGGGNVPTTPSNPFEALAMEMEKDGW